MIGADSWLEFQKSGMLWWVNRILHTFGWAVVFEFNEGVLIGAYPQRVEYLGFSEEDDEKGLQAFKENFDDKL